MQSYLTVSGESTAEYSEKRSRFIASVYHCESEEQASSVIAATRSKYWDARHNVFAYVLRENSVSRFSDDGEPHGTAGKPVLEVINGNKLSDVLVIVTRYFGGVLLGTGGLVRAYSTAAKNALQTAKIVEMRNCVSFVVDCAYGEHSALSAIITSSGGIITDTAFTDRVKILYSIPENEWNLLDKKMSEAFSGRVTAVKTGECFAPFEKNIN